jgi:hypothetical protein
MEHGIQVDRVIPFIRPSFTADGHIEQAFNRLQAKEFSSIIADEVNSSHVHLLDITSVSEGGPDAHPAALRAFSASAGKEARTA